MPFRGGDVVVRQVDANTWELREDIGYDGASEAFVVPRGFRTDLASVPRPFVWLLPRYGAYTKAAILHDFLCQTAPVSRADADGIFRRAMRELDVPLLRRWIMWAAVRFASRLRGAGLGQVGIWLLVALPALVFVAVPALVVLAWLALFWVVESVAFLVLKPFSHKRVNKPELLLKMS